MAELFSKDQDAELDRFFEQMMDDIYLKYHCHSTDHTSLPVNDDFNGEISFYDGIGRGLNFSDMQGLPN